MRGFFYKVLLVAVVLVVTSLFIPSHHNMAAADFKKNNNTQGVHGCVGLHCLIADDVAADLFMDLHGSSRNLLATDSNKNFVSPKSMKPEGEACQANGGRLTGSTGCLPPTNLDELKKKCDERNRAKDYC